MPVRLTAEQIFAILAARVGVDQFRTRDISETRLRAKYKNSNFACPEIRQVKKANGTLVDEAPFVTFERVRCTQHQTLSQLRV